MNKSFSNTSGNKNRGKNILFLFLTAVIALITIISALRGQTTFESEQYGTTSDYDLFLNENQEIRTEFTISVDGFQGINVKFSDKANICGEDTLIFTLIDNETDSVIARHELELRKVLPQIDVFIPLPYEESEDKEVTVCISGKNLSKDAGFRISKNSDKSSVLYIGNYIKRNRYLVFSAAYKTKKLISMQAIIKGILYFLLLILVYIWPGAFMRADRSGKGLAFRGGRTLEQPATASSADKGRRPAGSAAPKKGFAAGKIKPKQILIFAGITLLYCFLAFFVYARSIEQYEGVTETTAIVKNFDQESDGTLSLTSDEDVFEQYFTVDQDKFSAVSYDVSVPKADSKAKLHVRILDRKGNESYYDDYVRVKDLPSERGAWRIALDSLQQESLNIEYLIRITPVGFEDTEVCFYPGEPTAKTAAYKDGALQGSYPVLRAFYSEYTYLKTEFIIFAVAIYVFLVMCCLFLTSKKLSVQSLYIPVCLFLGVLYMVVIPVYSVPDEYAHIDTAYSLSNRMLGIEQPVDMNGYDYRRECDIETEEYLTYYATLDDYRRYTHDIFTDPDQEALSLCVMRSSAANVNQLFFVPAAVGLTIGRIFHLSTIPLYLLGRFCNLLAYVLLTYWGFRKLPALKEAYFIYVSLPISLQQAASFSYDSMMIALALVFMAYCLYIAWKETNINRADAAVLLFTLVLMGSVKGGVYLPVCLLMFLIPIERGWNWIKSLPLIAATGFCVCIGFLQDNISRLLTKFLSGSSTRISPFAGKEMFTFGDLIHHPAHMVKMYMATFFEEGSRMIYEFFGGKMGSIYDIQLPWMYIIVFLAIMTLAISRDKSRFSLTTASKVLCAAITFFTFALIGFAMLLADTPKTSSYIIGLQGRYFLPSLFLMFYIFIKMQPEEEIGKLRSRMLCYFMTHSIFLLNIVMIVIPKLVKSE